jgi:error-prone DNA polymerase
VSREITEHLVRLGAFDGLGVRREELVPQVPLLYAGARPVRAAAAPGTAPAAAGAGLDQPRLALDEHIAPLTFLPSWSEQQRAGIELELLGLNVGAHPLHFVHDRIAALGVTPLARLSEVPHGRRVRLAGALERAQMPWIRSGHRTLFLTLEDETELGQVVVFNDVYLKYGGVLKDALYFFVEGELQNDAEHGLAVVAHRIMDLAKVLGHEGVLPDGRPDAAPAPAGERRAGLAGGALASGRPDAWELPAVEPRTRPGRTG